MALRTTSNMREFLVFPSMIFYIQWNVFLLMLHRHSLAGLCSRICRCCHRWCLCSSIGSHQGLWGVAWVKDVKEKRVFFDGFGWLSDGLDDIVMLLDGFLLGRSRKYLCVGPGDPGRKPFESSVSVGVVLAQP